MDPIGGGMILSCSSAEAKFGEITLPFDLAAQTTNGGLPVDLNEEPKRDLYRIFLRPHASTTHRLPQ